MNIKWTSTWERDFWAKVYLAARKLNLRASDAADSADLAVHEARQRVPFVDEFGAEGDDDERSSGFDHHLWADHAMFSGRPIACRRCDAICDDSNRDASCPGRA